jgi:AcrR family transcriptional regulator
MPRPRGRPREFDRAVALQRAMEVFWSKGYEGAQLVDLTAAMGINPPSFYSAFRSKKAAFREVVSLYQATVAAGPVRALEEEVTAYAGIQLNLMRSVDVALSAPGKNGCMLILGAVDRVPRNAAARTLLQNVRAQTTRLIRQRLDRGIREGDLSPNCDVASLANFYSATIQGLSLQARDGACREDLLSIVRIAMHALDTCVVKPQPRR